MQARNAISTDKYCVFRSRQDRFCLPATDIRNVASRPVLCPVPLTHEVLAGLAHEQREFFPVYSFSNARDAAAGPDLEPHMLVMIGENGAWGLLVDEVFGLESLELSLHPRRDRTAGWSSVAIGSTTWCETFVTAIDPRVLIEFIQSRVQEFWDGVRQRAAVSAPLIQIASVSETHHNQR
jgi:chemotaxis signal transduction protein